MQRIALFVASCLFCSPFLGAQGGVDWGPWLSLGPFDNPGGVSAVNDELAPEKDLRHFHHDRQGPRLEVKWQDKGQNAIKWQRVALDVDAEGGAEPVETAQAARADEGVIHLRGDLGEALTDNAAAYLYRSIDVDGDRSLRVLFAADDGFRVWLNGEALMTQAGSRPLSSGEFSAALDLRKGLNHLLVKVVNGRGDWGFQMLHSPTELARVKAELTRRVNRAIERGVDYILSRQFPDGSWEYHSYPYRNGQTALSLYALLKSGLPPTHPACTRAVQFLKSRRPVRTYSAACILMAYEAMHDEALLGEMEAVTELLLEWRSDGYAYPQGAVDLSNTQYGALGLRAAARAGIKIRDKVWIDLVEDTLPYQTDDGGFSYRIGGAATGSMTAAGLTVLGIAINAQEKKGLPGRLAAETDRSVQAGLEWLAQHWTVSVNPTADSGGEQRWHPYYLYGLERVGGFFGLDYIGGFDWYSDGAQRLTISQHTEGKWATASGEPEPNTAFALLFLERATAPISGGRTRTRRNLWGQDDPGQPMSLRAKGSDPLAVWISSWGDDTLAQHTWPQVLGGGLRVRHVEYLLDGEPATSVVGDPTTPTEIERYPAQLQGLESGDHTLIARVTLAKPPPDSADVLIESAQLPFTLEAAMDLASLAYGRDAGENLLRDAAFEVRASSVFSDAYKPGRALDGRMSTSWLSANTEEQQSLTIEFKRALKADTLLVSQALPHVDQPYHVARITKFLLIVNGNERKALEFEMDVNVRRKTQVDLGRSLTIRSLEFRVLSRLRGETQPYAVGLAELELLRRGGKRR